jgi:uncharacterized membrane protein YgaE (UPF0421/DUF939 family)
VTSGAPPAPARRRPSTHVVVAARLRQGWGRVRDAFLPILQAAVAGAIAYVIAHKLAHHPYPFFAPVTAWVVLGFSFDRSLRRVGELAIGVALGVGLGDLFGHVFGSGAWQIATVLVLAACIARFLDRGPMLTSQAAVQAIVLVGLPAGAIGGGPFGRWLDAVIGVTIAFVVAVLTPHDPRRHQRALARRAVDELAGVLHLLARGLGEARADDVADALVRARATQPALDEWTDSSASARELARLSPAAYRHRQELTRLGDTAVLVDRAIRNTRVLARRSATVVDDETATTGPNAARALASPAVHPPETHETEVLAQRVEGLARAADELGSALANGRDPARARELASEVARGLDPFEVAPDDWQVQGLVLLVRSLVVDLLEAAGTSERDARGLLPEL